MRALATLSDALYRRIMAKKRKLESAGPLSPSTLKELEARMEVEFVYNTNSIEGSKLSRGETELVMRGMTVKGKNIADVLAAKNHPDAIKLVKELAFGKANITGRKILDIHGIIMAGIISAAGEYRRGDVNIGGASFTPPPAYQVGAEMEELFEFVNKNPDELRAIELAAHAHYFLTWIHPFDDGNGRMARLLLNFILVRNRYPFAIVKHVEQKKYLTTLADADSGDFEPFLVYIARCVEQTLDLYLLAIEGEKSGEAKPELLALGELAKGTPYSAEYLSLLARRGLLDAVKVGRVWMSTKKTIDTYIKEHGNKPA